MWKRKLRNKTDQREVKAATTERILTNFKPFRQEGLSRKRRTIKAVSKEAAQPSAVCVKSEAATVNRKKAIGGRQIVSRG
jgi:hypothetical protein